MATKRSPGGSCWTQTRKYRYGVPSSSRAFVRAAEPMSVSGVQPSSSFGGALPLAP